ncbi:DUF1552 domain-containing protein [Corallococcus sp. bb12-1]|uniref:DUF1552 domain-containing protein n=1 Tax=Corallococcus sp. bb12-1 TaxID=2996784 RepID=UPI002271BEC8|nr:DUF1552 domain-containing protein [Corallococcus sp. bb12-1]MCY1041870.1 DUF1552 domain-containing protein [Corallococcus sp. bb12-1]
MVTRRTLLQGLGAGLFAPFMSDVLAQPAKPGRLVIVLECNGIYPRALLSAGTRTALGGRALLSDYNFSDAYPETPLIRTGDALSTALSLGPLAAPAGGGLSLVERSAVVLGLSSTIAGGGHSSGAGALSCAVDGTGPTFDTVMAPRLKRTTPFGAVRLGTSSSLSAIAYQTCSLGPRKPVGVLVNPTLAYDSTFGALMGGAASGRDRNMLLDLARADTRDALAVFKGNSHERLKLERYLESLETLRAREDLLRSLSSKVTPLLPPLPADNPLLTGSERPDSLAVLEAQFQIATTALLGGLTNVVVLAAGTSGFDVTYPADITGLTRHQLQHEIEAGANWNAVVEVTRRHVALVAKLARTLAATPEVGASGSMLDHTAILFMSDNGEQHHSTGREWPLLLVGGNALGLKTDGRTVVFPRDGRARNRQVSNLFNSLGHALGDTSLDHFGLEFSTRIAPGPLSELYG